MPESLESKLWRWRLNLFLWRAASGARVTYLAGDWREIRVELVLNWRTDNYVGTIYGGSMYAAVDPFYMLMLIRNLGREYIVWDKAASIRFRKPGRSTLYARFVLDQAELEAVRAAAAQAPSIDRIYRVDLCDAQGVVHASVEKTLYIRRRTEGEKPERDAQNHPL